jgi:hypothetical protein
MVGADGVGRGCEQRPSCGRPRHTRRGACLVPSRPGHIGHTSDPHHLHTHQKVHFFSMFRCATP